MTMSRTTVAFFVLCVVAATQERPPVKCVENSPERRGEEGCSILVTRPLVASTKKPVYWHIDRFDSLEAATKCAGPDGVAAEAHGSVQTGLHLEAGESRVLPAGLVHRGRVTGTGVRSVLALILHDSAQPASHDLSDSPSLVACK
jgi:hypothetical protein